MRENPVRSGISPDARPNYNATPHLADDELDKRIRKAVEKSEGQINRTSPSKYQNEALDTYIHSYMKKEPVQNDRPLLYDISSHLRMENRFTPTLKVYSNNTTNQYNQNSGYVSNSIVRGDRNYQTNDSNEGTERDNRPPRYPANVRLNNEMIYVNNPPSYGNYQNSSERGYESKCLV